MTDPSSNALVRVESTDTGGERGREYRKGIWTLEETIILLEAKKQDDERRMRDGDKERGKTAELRWKWVENYCFKHGCVRSQNQCNDKWDNLLRDYKKVREYENRLGHGRTSYWQLENHERKDRGLPSNLLYQVYDALHEIVDKRYAHKITHAHASGENPSMSLQEHEQQRQHTSQPNLSQQQQQQQTLPTHQQISTHQQQQQKQQQQQQQPASGGCSIEMSDSSESDTSELPHSPAHSDDSHICCQAQGLARLNRRLETLIGKVNEQKMKQRRLTAAVDDGFAQLEADLQSFKEEVAEDARKRNTQAEIIQALSERIFSMEVQVGTMSFEEQVRKEVGGASGSTSKTGPAG